MFAKKWYRQYRYENRYDAPLKILLIDTLIGVSKLGVFLMVLFAGWLGFQYIISPGSQQKFLDTAMAVAPQANIASKQVTDGGQAINLFAGKKSVGIASSTDTNAGVIEDSLTSEKSAAVENKTPRVVGERWILAQKSSAFILQFGSSLDDIELIKEFLPIIKSDQPIAIFQFKKTPSGRPVYGIASGVFDDLDSALASIESLTEPERQYDPWVRPLLELKQQVSTMVGSASG